MMTEEDFKQFLRYRQKFHEECERVAIEIMKRDKRFSTVGNWYLDIGDVVMRDNLHEYRFMSYLLCEPDVGKILDELGTKVYSVRVIDTEDFDPYITDEELSEI